MPAPRPARPTLAAVAREAGVSLGSASRVMHAPESVRAATRAAVERAAAKLGYVADGRARALASGRSMMVGIVLPTINNPVYAEFTHVLQRRLSAEGYMLAVQAHEYDAAAETAQIRALAERGIDALVLVGTDHDPAVARLLAAARLPHVFVWSTDEAPETGCVGFSNRAAMREMAEHLIALGHRRLGIVSGATQGNERARARLAGVTKAIAAAGLPPAAVSLQPFSIAGGRAGLAELIKANAGLTAILCTTDLMAAGALAEARERGIAVPHALSITGFDDIDLANATTPCLTTIRAPITEMGLCAGEAILRQIAGGAPEPSLTIPTRVIVRESCAPPPQAGG
ncbi:MAG: hypothetical protein RIS94_1186 [Pseudomonadota bacterium]|jgi:LacI family transcriptional regulator